MSEQRRVGRHPGVFSREIRSEAGGGTIPDDWGCRVIDLDTLYAAIDGELFHVSTEGRVWAWYRTPVKVVALAEQKSYSDLQQSWDVTRALSVLAGVEGFRIVAQRDGTRRVTDTRQQTVSYATTREFIEHCIRPLIEEPPGEEDWPF